MKDHTTDRYEIVDRVDEDGEPLGYWIVMDNQPDDCSWPLTMFIHRSYDRCLEYLSNNCEDYNGELDPPSKNASDVFSEEELAFELMEVM